MKSMSCRWTHRRCRLVGRSLRSHLPLPPRSFFCFPQSLASLIYSRAELFDGYLARNELDVARQLQQLIGKLDAPRRSLLMGKLSAVSGKRAAPLVLAWAASTMQRDLTRLLAKNEGDAVVAFYRDLVSAARMAAAASGGAGPKATTEAELVAWLLDPKTSNLDWELLLRMPRLEELLGAVGSANQRLGLACSLLGFNEEAGAGAAAARSAVANTLGSLATESLALIQGALGQSRDNAVPLGLLASAATSCSGDAATPSLAPALAEAAIGLALERLVGAALGLYLQPDVQLVTRVLGVSPFQVLPSGSGAEAAAGKPEGPPGPAITLDLLRSVVQQVVALNPAGMDVAGLLSDAAAAAAAPAVHQGSWGGPWVLETLQVAAKAGGPASPAAELLSALSAWRKAAMLAGVPCIAATATRAELAALTDGEAAAMGATAGRMEAGGRALEALLLPSAAAGSSSHTPDLETVGAATAGAHSLISLVCKPPLTQVPFSCCKITIL